ncbi:hypothetical protein JHK82_033386 [Glycine max]|nr:hypothetical protein JHK85_034107 [Glycine max]KAG5118966.1 hypothetical protein JHK82_033386 [Glycine max]KAG5139959.1 hypothetical protein JHK84_033727 [Glycine max]
MYTKFPSLSVDINFASMTCASKQYLCAIEASSHMISLANFNSSACLLPWWMLHAKLSRVGTVILSFECAILPPGSSKDVIPLDATISIISRLLLMADDNVCHMIVLSVP